MPSQKVTQTGNTSAEHVIVDLNVALERVRSADHGATGRLATPVASLPGLRIVMVSMNAGAVWQEHSTAGRITVQPLTGEIRMRAGTEEMALTPGKVAAFASNVKHDVMAVTEAAFLLTVARPDLD